MLHEALTVISNIAVAVGLPVMLLALAISAVLVMAGWGRRQDLLQRQGRPIVTDRVELGQTPFAAGVLDVAAETAALLGRFREPRRTAVRCAGACGAARSCGAHRSSRLAGGPRRHRGTGDRGCVLWTGAVGRRPYRGASADYCVGRRRARRSRLAVKPAAASGTARRVARRHDGSRCPGWMRDYRGSAIARGGDQPPPRGRVRDTRPGQCLGARAAGTGEQQRRALAGPSRPTFS